MEEYHSIFGLRWLLKQLHIHPNAYYNYRKHRKQASLAYKEKIKQEILQIYHERRGIIGYRMVKKHLERRGIFRSNLTIHKYMNRELGLFSVTRRKRPDYKKGTAHKVFENLLKHEFKAKQRNQRWCTDFTYLFLSSGEKRYNCTILDLYDRSVIASVTDKKITSDLAIRTVRKAISSQVISRADRLILHPDQGSQYTSREFVEFCVSQGIRQSMSKAGCPYDNAYGTVFQYVKK